MPSVPQHIRLLYKETTSEAERLSMKRQVKEFLKKSLRGIIKDVNNEGKLLYPIVKYMDAPIISPQLACIVINKKQVFTPNFSAKDPDARISEVPLGKVKVTGSFGRIFQNGIWLMQFSWYGGQTFLSPSYQDVPLYLPNFSQSRELSGETASTIASFDATYGHVLLDELPFLIYLLNDARYTKYNAILCSKMAERLLERVSHPHMGDFCSRIIAADPDTLYEVSSLTAFRRSGCKMNPSLEELNLLRDIQFRSSLEDNLPKKIFLNRANEARKIENDLEVRSLLSQYGIEIVSIRDYENPWLLFSKADLVVGVAGSDLSDCAFMRKGAALVEIHPSDHVKPYNWNVARTLDLNYIAVEAYSTHLRGTPLGNGDSSIYVDILGLRAALEAV